MLSKITRLRKNRQYEYSPRYYDDKGKGNPYKMEPKLDKFRSTLTNQRGLKNKFNNAFEDAKREGDRNLKMRMVIIIAVLLFIVLYILDFDLSIFFGN
ncbi:riboflavin synthase subunit beta [Maribacter sp. 2210JD10-5]|uniref:riboflavin synthase subunit beta n=1 Tax=Maribacter sp. 2210JD10-5 TaxID=3386272 RepID=UPI0039BC89C4